MAPMSMSTSGFAAQRGPAPGFRFTLFAIIAITLMFLDQRSHWLERARYGLAAAAYPLHLAINSPSEAVRWVHGTYEVAAYGYDALFDHEDRRLDVAITTDAARYQPGGHVNATVRTTDSDGKPVSST